MKRLRNITAEEQQALISQGCRADSWGEILVSDDFSVDQLSNVRFGGRVEIASGVRIADSYVASYRIGEGTTIECVTRLECRSESTFGNGTTVNSVNENGGRQILIYDSLKAQTAYAWAMYRHRKEMVNRFSTLAKEYAETKRDTIGTIGAQCRIVGARLLREVSLGDSVTIEGASMLECGTIGSGSFVGVDVKCRDFIVAEDARIDTGATMERCFVGERSIVASGFSAVDSLIFANSHLENGEAAALFAGPCTVSHHKSSLLIAGIFSFFNAGSGSNQSNHLFKCGAVHQAVHSRGCKFASGAYVMAPAREGAFTMVKGSHSRHHDTSAFPYSYLLESGDGRSTLMPGANLTSYGTRRDIEKWRLRDRRTRRRDIINFEEYNPYITGAMVKAVNTIHTLMDGDAEADTYMWERVSIRRAHLRRGVGLYNKAIAASIGAMLSEGTLLTDSVGGEWVDMAGAYMPLSLVEPLLESDFSSLAEVDEGFEAIAKQYKDLAHTYAWSLLTQLLGHEPTAEEIAQTIEAAKKAEADLRHQTDSDMERDCSMSMAVGYGIDSADEAVREADFKAVRSL